MAVSVILQEESSISQLHLNAYDNEINVVVSFHHDLIISKIIIFQSNMMQFDKVFPKSERLESC